MFVFAASAVLAVQLTLKWRKTKFRPLLYWSIGLWLFALGTFQEILFAINISSEFLLASYLFVVGVLVLSLSLGSAELAHARRLKIIYWIFAVVAVVLLLWSLVVSPMNAVPSPTYNSMTSNIIQEHVVLGNPPLLVDETSSLITFPASLVIIAMALKSYRQKRDPKLLSIVAGVIVVAVVGTGFILSAWPELLYPAELVGIVLLWIGFNG